MLDMQQGGSAFGAESADRTEGIRSIREETEEHGETLLSLSEAAHAVGTTVQALWVRVQRGELKIHRFEEGGRATTKVALREILHLFKGHELSQGPAGSPGSPGSGGPPQEPGGAAPRPEAPRHGAPAFAPPVFGAMREPSHPPRPVGGGIVPPGPGEFAAGSSPSQYSAPPSYPRANEPSAPTGYELPRVYPADTAASQDRGRAEMSRERDGQERSTDPARTAPGEGRPGDLDVGAGNHLRELEQLREALIRERGARAEAEGRLAAAERFEESLRSQAERLESRLERTQAELSESKKESLTLARALGQAEGRVNLLEEGKPHGAPSGDAAAKRRWWHRKDD